MSKHHQLSMGPSHLLTSEMEGGVILRKAETVDFRAQIGGAIERTRLLSGLLLKEFATAIGRDERQVARWITGAERPQFDAVFAVVSLRGNLIIALAELADVDVITTISIRRIA